MAIEKLYTVKEVAELLQVSQRTVFRYMQPDYKNQLKASKVGGTWRITEMDLKEFLAYSNNYSGAENE